MASEPAAERQFEALPVFPLPSTVFFPGTVLPLHVFEPRYRDMVSDALASDRRLAVALAKGPTDPPAMPAVHDIAGCGEIIHAEKLADGRYNILLQGQHRVRLLEELPRDKLYRRFRAEVIARPGEDALSEAWSELAKFQSCVLSLQTVIAERDATLLEVLRATADPIELSDILSASLIPNLDVQQRLLEALVLRERIAMLVEALAEVMLQFAVPDQDALN